MNKIIYKVGLKLLSWGINYVVAYADADKDGKVSKKEFEDALGKLYRKFQSLMRKIRKK